MRKAFAIFVVVIAGILFGTQNISAGIVNTSWLHLGCHTGSGTKLCTGTGPAATNAGQLYLLKYSNVQNDNPTPTVKGCITTTPGSLVGYCKIYQSRAEGIPRPSGEADIGSNNKNPYRYSTIQIEVQGTITNSNDFEGQFQAIHRYVEIGNVSMSPTAIRENQNSILTGNGKNAWSSFVNDPDHGTVQLPVVGSDILSVNIKKTYTYTPTGKTGNRTLQFCLHGPDQATANQTDKCKNVTVNVVPDPVVDLRCNGSNGPCNLSAGAANPTLLWTTNINTVNCVATGAWSGNKAPLGGTEVVDVPQGVSRTYIITCNNSVGAYVADQVTVTRGASAPSVDLRCDGANGPCEIPLGGSSSLTWSSNNTTTCTASCPSGVCDPVWSGAQAKNNATGFPIGPITDTGTYRLSCTGPGGSKNDSVIVGPPALLPPVADNVTMTAPTSYCSVGPSAEVNWTYTPGNGNQKTYQVQIDTAPYDFSAPVVDSGTVTSSEQLYATALEFGTSYRARVLVTDQADQPSEWAVPSDVFITPPHACPQADFTVDPNPPAVSEPAQFTDTTVYDPLSVGQSWIWDFGDGLGTSAEQNPSYTYGTEQEVTVLFQVVDDACTCQTQQTFTIGTVASSSLPAPTWKEVQPK